MTILKQPTCINSKANLISIESFLNKLLWLEDSDRVNYRLNLVFVPTFDFEEFADRILESETKI
jgi:hypothetical protein